MKWEDKGGSEFEQPPVGTHVAICYRVIDLGTQKGEYKGEVVIRRQCIIGWELTNELMTRGDAIGKPFSVAKFYTASLHEKANLRRDLQNWRGKDFTPEELKGFDAKNILGKACMLSLTPNDDGKVRVTGVMALPKGHAVPRQVNKDFFLSLEKDEFDQAKFDALTEGIKKFVLVSPEYRMLVNPAPHQGATFDDMKDDIPF